MRFLTVIAQIYLRKYFSFVSFLVILGLLSVSNNIEILLKGFQKILQSSRNIILTGGRSIKIQLNGPEMKQILLDTDKSDAIIELCIGERSASLKQAMRYMFSYLTIIHLLIRFKNESFSQIKDNAMKFERAATLFLYAGMCIFGNNFATHYTRIASDIAVGGYIITCSFNKCMVSLSENVHEVKMPLTRLDYLATMKILKTYVQTYAQVNFFFSCLLQSKKTFVRHVLIQ